LEATKAAQDTFPLDYVDMCVRFNSPKVEFYWEEEMPVNHGYGAFVFFCVTCGVSVIVSIFVGVYIMRKKWDMEVQHVNDNADVSYSQLNEALTSKDDPII
jgi:hypothetical protein